MKIKQTLCALALAGIGVLGLEGCASFNTNTLMEAEIPKTRLTNTEEDAHLIILPPHSEKIEIGEECRANPSGAVIESFYKNGQIRWRYACKGGILEGKQFEWYSNSQSKSVLNYGEGEQEGTQVEWHENGERSYFWNYSRGKLAGRQSRWNPNGKKTSEENYDWRTSKKNGRNCKWAYQECNIFLYDEACELFLKGKQDGIMVVEEFCESDKCKPKPGICKDKGN